MLALKLLTTSNALPLQEVTPAITGMGCLDKFDEATLKKFPLGLKLTTALKNHINFTASAPAAH